MGLLTEMMADADSPSKLVYDGSLTIRVVQESPGSLPLPGMSLAHAACDLNLSVRFTEVEPARPEDLPATLDAEMIKEIQAELAELAEMDDRVELTWSGREQLDGWKRRQRLSFGELMGLDSNLSIDRIWWSEAPSSWCQAFEQEMIVRGAQQPFLDDTIVLPCVIGAEEVDLCFKHVAPCTDLAILRGGGASDAVLVRMRGLGGGEEVPPFVGSVDVASLLEPTPQDASQDDF